MCGCQNIISSLNPCIKGKQIWKWRIFSMEHRKIWEKDVLDVSYPLQTDYLKKFEALNSGKIRENILLLYRR